MLWRLTKRVSRRRVCEPAGTQEWVRAGGVSPAGSGDGKNAEGWRHPGGQLVREAKTGRGFASRFDFRQQQSLRLRQHRVLHCWSVNPAVTAANRQEPGYTASRSANSMALIAL